MGTNYEKYGFYTVDIEYIKYLHARDNEVFYNKAKGYEKNRVWVLLLT